MLVSLKNKTAIILFFSLSLTCLVNNNLIAQNSNEESAKDSESFVDKLSVSPSVGILHSFTDLAIQPTASSFFKPSQNKLGFGLNVNYDFLNVLRLSTGVLAGKLTANSETVNTLGAVNEPRDLGLGIFYQTNIFELTLPRIDLNVTKLIFKDNSTLFNSLSAHLFLSHGLLFFDSKIYATEDESVHLLYSKHRGQSSKTTEAVSSLGLDLSYKLNDRLDVNAGSAIKYVWNDRLDAWETPGSSNDYFSYTSVGVTFYLKNRSSNNKKSSKTKENVVPPPVEIVEEEPLHDTLKPKLTVYEDDAVEEEKVKKEEEVLVEKIETVQEEVSELEEKEAVIDTTAKPEVVQEETIEPEVTEEIDKEEKELIPEVSKDTVKTDTVASPATPAPASTIYNGRGNFIIVAAFQTLKRAKISAAEHTANGQMATIVKNRTNTMYLISIGRYDDRQEALTKMREVRKTGTYKDAWVFYKVVEQ